MSRFQSCLASTRSLTTCLGAVLLLSLLASPGLAEGSLSGQVKTGGESQNDPYTITNETLDRVRPKRPATPYQAPQPQAEPPREAQPPAKGPECLSIELLNQTGAQAAELAQEYFLAELDEVASENDLSTPAGWTAAAPKLDAIAGKLMASAAQAYDPDVQRLLFGFAQDMQETASWVQTRPEESAEKFRRGEPIFSRRF